MRAVVQRVSNASVVVDGEVVGAISQGLLVLVGVEGDDNEEDMKWLSGKIVGMRIFSDAEGKMNLSVKEIDGEILVISQFTLHAATKKGNRPSFIKAARPEFAVPMYESFLKQLAVDLGKEVQKGIFGADMKVTLLNDGPVTILMDTKQKDLF